MELAMPAVVRASQAARAEQGMVDGELAGPPNRGSLGWGRAKAQGRLRGASPTRVQGP